MIARKGFVCVCLFLLLAGGIGTGVGYVVGGQLERLDAEGVVATGTVTRLSTYTTGTGTSRRDDHRVFLDADWNGRQFELVDDIAKERWHALSEGSPVEVVFVPDGSGLCLVGSKADVQRSRVWARWAVYLGASGSTIGVIAFGGAWISLGMPSLRDWINGLATNEPSNPYAAA